MKQFHSRHPASRLGALLVLAVALTLGACDNDIDVTGPEFPELPSPDSTADSIWVAGTLATTDGFCIEARLIYDGRVIAHGFCRSGGDCEEMQLAGLAPEGGRRHTVELEVIRQEPPGGELVYRAWVELRGDPLGSPGLDLGPVRKTLRAGESIIFEIDLP